MLKKHSHVLVINILQLYLQLTVSQFKTNKQHKSNVRADTNETSQMKATSAASLGGCNQCL